MPDGPAHARFFRGPIEEVVTKQPDGRVTIQTRREHSRHDAFSWCRDRRRPATLAHEYTVIEITAAKEKPLVFLVNFFTVAASASKLI